VPLSNAELVAQQVVSALGIQEGEGLTLNQVLVNHLKGKSLLLILDNCEHVLQAVSSMAELLLREAPNLKILATSRQPLGIPGEKVWWIPSLTFPETGEDLDPEKLLEFEAIKLFVERALAASSDFMLTRQNARAVAQVCAHLDGMPLAIELAGARVRILTVEEIAARLDDRFKLLVDERTTSNANKPCAPWWIGVMTCFQRQSVRCSGVYRFLPEALLCLRPSRCAQEASLSRQRFSTCSHI
jgi:non-specific serine/threonine protein kinase